MEAKLFETVVSVKARRHCVRLNSFEYGSQKANEIVMQGMRPLEIFYN